MQFPNQAQSRITIFLIAFDLLQRVHLSETFLLKQFCLPYDFNDFLTVNEVLEFFMEVCENYFVVNLFLFVKLDS